MINNYANQVTGEEYNMFMSVMHVSVSKHLWDAHLTVLWANDYFYQLTGYEKSEYAALFHNHLDEYYHDDPDTAALIMAAISQAYAKGCPDYEVECRMPAKGGRSAWVRIAGRFTDELCDGLPVLYTVYTDITDLKELQLKLEDALHTAEQANREKTDFLSRMSHDIRTPMNAIIGMTEIAAGHLENPPKLRDCLKKISLSSQHLLSLINDVLDMSKIESGNMVPDIAHMSLPELIENIVTIIHPEVRGRGQHFSIRLHQIHHEYYYSDALRLRQVFINILSNACKFTPTGGSITLDITEHSLPQPDTAQLIFTFTDTGIGMKPEFVARIFDAFTRESGNSPDQTEGTGLGMTITKRIVDMLHGSIHIESHPGNGSVFTVQLPLRVHHKDDAANPSNIPLAGKRLLVADGDQNTLQGLPENLAAYKISTSLATDTRSAIRMIKEAHLRGQDYDAVLLDWKLPGSGGVAAAKSIHESLAGDTPPLLLSAYDWSDIENGADTSSISGFLQKPLFCSTLVQELKKYLPGQTPTGYTPNQYGIHDFTGKVFLLVEDNQLNLEIAQELLTSAGAVVEYARNGQTGLDKFSQSPEGYYDLILMDIQMPVMDGHAAARAIRGLPRKDARTVPILAMTADAFTEDIEAAKNSGMNGHLAKPLNVSVMNRSISDYLNSDANAFHADN